MGKVCTIEVDEDVVAGEAFGGENRATQVGICEVGLREVYGCVAIRAIGSDNRATQVGFGEVSLTEVDDGPAVRVFGSEH